MEIKRDSLATLLERIAGELSVAAQGLREKTSPAKSPKAAVEQAERGVCLVCDGRDQPEGTRLKRGQCVNCHAKTMRRIKAGKLSESKLIKEGKLLYPKPGGKADTSFPLDALADAAGILSEQKREQAKTRRKRKPAQNNT